MECNICGKQKTLTEFYANGRGKQYPPCKDCRKRIERERYQVKGEQIRARNSAWQKSNRHKMNILAKQTRLRRREKVLEHYGGKCVCCGETAQEFLAVDHIDGNGRQHRKSIGTITIYTWLIRNNFPSGFQILCHNCNYAKHFYKQCPHASRA